MNIAQFKSIFADTVLSFDSLKEFWSFFSDVYKYDDPEKALLYANTGKFKENIYEFDPLFTPFTDYEVEITKFKITEKYFKVSIGKITEDDEKIKCNDTVSFHIVNGVTQKPKEDKEYFRLVILHILANPLNKDDQPFRMSKVMSAPKLFDKNKHYSFSLSIPDEFKSKFNSYKYHRTYAFFINFFTDHYTNEAGVPESFDNIFSASEVTTLNSMVIEDSDINYPPYFLEK